MSTEYRRGIPSTAHIEAATRLGLLWLGSDMWLHRFRNQNARIEVCYFEDPNATPYWEAPDFGIEDLGFRPVRPDGTPVDWEVLDQEVVRVGQQGQSATVMPTTSATPTTQPQGFRADLRRRICEHFQLFWMRSLSEVIAIDVGGDIILSGSQPWSWSDAPGSEQSRSDILTRWAVYQELKPLYDLVDGAQGEAAMPRDVEAEWDRQSLGSAYNYETDGDWVFGRDSLGVFARSAESDVWRADPSGSQASFRNFAAVLDAVAERRVAERQASRGQTLREQLAELPQTVQAERAADEARRLQMEARLQPGPLAQPLRRVRCSPSG